MMQRLRPWIAVWCLSRFEEQDCYLADVEVDEVFCFVRDVRSEISTHDAMPRRTVLFVELFFDVRGDVLLDVVVFDGACRCPNRIVLHVFTHVGIFDHDFVFGCSAHYRCCCRSQQVMVGHNLPCTRTHL